MANAFLVPKIYLIGDSNTQLAFGDGGFGTRIANEYIRKCDVVNRGYSGYTSDHLCVMLPHMLKNDNQPEGVIRTATILCGSNDAVLADIDDRHVPIERFKKNIEFIITSLEEAKVENIILISPPPIDDKEWDNYLQRTKNKHGANSNIQTKIYADVCEELSSQYKVHFVNLYENMMAKNDWTSWFNDGLHFNTKGHGYVFYQLKPILDNIYATAGMVYPDWTGIDNVNPSSKLS